jgi:hypothetical protein
MIFAYIMSERAKKLKEAATSDDIDKRLATVKEAVTAALDGSPVTKEQREKLNKAFGDFVRHDSSSSSL